MSERKYLDMIRYILDNGQHRPDRTGTGVISVFGYQATYDLYQHGFPLLTTKKVDFSSIVHELLWFLRGETNIKYLVDRGVNIWNSWPLKHYNLSMIRDNFDGADRQMTMKQFVEKIKTDDAFAADWGELGPVYGKQWREWGVYNAAPHAKTIDQIANVIESLCTDPYDRRHLVSAWNVADIPNMVQSGLPPCHVLFQFYARDMSFNERCNFSGHNFIWRGTTRYGMALRKDKEAMDYFHAKLDEEKVPRFFLDCHLYQRSADAFLGVPYNIASYSLLTMMIAQQVNMVSGRFVHSFGDLHIYKNHLSQVREQLSREVDPLGLPTVKINPRLSIDDYVFEDFTLRDYHPSPAIRAPIAV